MWFPSREMPLVTGLLSANHNYEWNRKAVASKVDSTLAALRDVSLQCTRVCKTGFCVMSKVVCIFL